MRIGQAVPALSSAQRDGEALADGRETVIVHRPMGSKPRAVADWGDLATAAWLLAGVPASLLTPRQRWRICGAAAGLSIRGRRASDARERIQRIGNQSAAISDRAVRLLYTARLAANLDIVRAVIRGPDCRTVCSGFQFLQQALADGLGAVLWIADFAGGGDATKIALARAGFRVTHLSRVEHGFSQSSFGIRLLNPIRLRFERAWLDDRIVFDRGNPAASMRQLTRRLRTNRIVSITASAHEGRTVVRANFLHGRITLATGALRLAAMIGAPLIPVFTIPRFGEPGTFDVILESPLTFPAGTSEDDCVRCAAAEYVERLESHVKRQPESWVGWRRNDQLT
jgi:lauroyl/myristoyl acyltransferase